MGIDAPEKRLPKGFSDSTAQYYSIGGTFTTEISGIKQSTEYYVSVEDVRSDKFNLTVLNRPLIRSLQLLVTPPSYTRLPSHTLDENVGDVSGYTGTKIDFTVLSSKPLQSVTVVRDYHQKLPLALDDHKATATLYLKSNSNYHIELQDKDGLTNPDPVEYFLKVIADEYPTVEIVSPGKNLDLTENMKLDMLLRAKDDFGFTKVRLAYRLMQSKYEQPQADFSMIEIPFQQSNQNQLTVQYLWDLSDLHLVPEDVIAYYAEVFDNDNVTGPKNGRSEIFLIRLPSLEEVFSDVAESHEQSLTSMQEAAKETEELKKDIEELYSTPAPGAFRKDRSIRVP